MQHEQDIIEMNGAYYFKILRRLSRMEHPFFNYSKARLDATVCLYDCEMTCWIKFGIRTHVALCFTFVYIATAVVCVRVCARGYNINYVTSCLFQVEWFASGTHRARHTHSLMAYFSSNLCRRLHMVSPGFVARSLDLPLGLGSVCSFVEVERSIS